MRTVLAIDEMLAHRVRRLLPGDVEIYSHVRMRDEGDEAVRRAVLRSQCVLAIGGAAWDPMPWLRQRSISELAPVVAVVPAMTLDIEDAVLALCVPFVVPVDVGEAARRVSASLRRAWSYRATRLSPVVVRPQGTASPRDRPRPQTESERRGGPTPPGAYGRDRRG